MLGKIKAVSLMSGGLDSALATRLVQEQDIEVLSLIFITGFDAVETRSTIFNPDVEAKDLHLKARRVAERIKSPYRIVDISDDFWKLVKNPPNGHGSGFNPCMDCRILMLKRAKQIMNDIHASFIITGEVLDQRPFTQNLQSLNRIDKQAGVKGLVLRPLSAKQLKTSLAESEGWVDRDKLMAIHGRRRIVQNALAREYGLLHVTAGGSGGCLCIDPYFTQKVKDFFEHSDKQKAEKRDFEWLKFGRHFRLSPQAKLIIGRDWVESEHLERLRQQSHTALLAPRDKPHPKAALLGNFLTKDLDMALSIHAGYIRPQKSKHPIRLIDDKGESVFWIKPWPKKKAAPFIV